MSAPAAPHLPSASPSPPATPDPDRPLGWRGWAALALCAAAASAALVHQALRGPAPAPVPGPRFEDRFERDAIGPSWSTVGGHWRIEQGQLRSPGVKNDPLWLGMRLPRDVAIAFDARSATAAGPRAGDIKFEVFGDGRHHASGYVCIFGGWGNTLSVIARLDEHGADRRTRADRKVEIGRTYHMRVERRGATLRWFVDGEPFLTFEDPAPLAGPGHDRFGFSSWEADVYFDDLRIEPL